MSQDKIPDYRMMNPLYPHWNAVDVIIQRYYDSLDVAQDRGPDYFSITRDLSHQLQTDDKS